MIAKRPDIFWRTHLKSLPKNFSVSDEFKDLIISMFQHDPAKRLSLQQILGHKWITSGAEPSNQELVATFNERIGLVNSSK